MFLIVFSLLILIAAIVFVAADDNDEDYVYYEHDDDALDLNLHVLQCGGAAHTVFSTIFAFAAASVAVTAQPSYMQRVHCAWIW